MPAAVQLEQRWLDDLLRTRTLELCAVLVERVHVPLVPAYLLLYGLVSVEENRTFSSTYKQHHTME